MEMSVKKERVSVVMAIHALVAPAKKRQRQTKGGGGGAAY